MADKDVLPEVRNNGGASLPEQRTSSHISVNPLYTPADLEGCDYDRDVGYPGQFPYTRGVQATMYRGRLWTMRQYAGMGDAEESNRRYKYLLANGTTGLSVAFDLPTQIGLDSDSPLSHGEVGYPGEFPYTRGVQPTMYRGRLWTMRQYAGMGDADFAHLAVGERAVGI